MHCISTIIMVMITRIIVPYNMNLLHVPKQWIKINVIRKNIWNKKGKKGTFWNSGHNIYFPICYGIFYRTKKLLKIFFRCCSIWKNTPLLGRTFLPKEKIFEFFRCYEKNQKFFPLDQRKKYLTFFVATKNIKNFFPWTKGKNFWFFS